MPDPISTLAIATGGAFLGKFVGPAAEHLGKLALEGAQQLGQKATAMLTTVGREPQPVELKLLVPLVQAASLESDSTLADKWAALLANAADPAQRVTIQPGFVEVLRQLTPMDAQLLTFIYQQTPIELPERTHTLLKIKDTVAHFSLPGSKTELSLDNLLRLRLFDTLTPMTYAGVLGITPDSAITSTVFGLAFLAAVTPPTP